MKTGECKFGERCKFHHPIDRSAPTATKLQQNIRLTLAGFPRREVCIILGVSLSLSLIHKLWEEDIHILCTERLNHFFKAKEICYFLINL